MDRLQFFPIAIGRYEHAGRAELLDVELEVAEIAEALSNFGAEHIPWNVPMERRVRTAVDERLCDWAAPALTANTFLYWVGHGESDAETATLWHARPATGGIYPEDLARKISEREGHRNAGDSWAIVVVDACKSKRFVQLLDSANGKALHPPERVMLVGTSADGATTLGKFREVLKTTLNDTFRANETISLWQLARELHRGLSGGKVVPPEVDGVLRRLVSIDTSAPLDIRDEIEGILSQLNEDERRHFIPKGQGAELGEVAWFFQGRAPECRAISRWLRTSRGGMLIVTGAAGSGKSALLGYLLTLSRPTLRKILINEGMIHPVLDEYCPQDDVFDAAIHLTGSSPASLIEQIAAIPPGDTPPGWESIDDQVTWLTSKITRTGRQLTILVDALDEAQEPLVIAQQILRPLAAVNGVRLLVGTRSSTLEGPDHPAPDDCDLLDALDAAEARVINVEHDAVAVTNYVSSRLHRALERRELVKSAGTGKRIAQVSYAIGSRDREFLFARLAVHEILARPDLLTATGEQVLGELLDGDHRQLFSQAVARLRKIHPLNQALLHALALAEGRGLPVRSSIWATMAQALTTRPVHPERISAVIKAAAPYLAVDKEDDQTVYRLAHATFAEYFRQVAPSRARQQQQRITAALIHAAQQTTGELNPYLIRHLAAHIGAAGPKAWQNLANHPDTVDRLDPTTIGAEALRTIFGRHPLPPEIAAVVGAQHLLQDLSPAQRRGTRQLAMARYAGVRRPAGTKGGRYQQGAWSIRWANMTQRPVHLSLTGHTDWISAITTFPSPRERMLLATGSHDQTIRIWDPVAGTSVGSPLSGHTGPVSAVTAFRDPGGRTLLASGSADTIAGMIRGSDQTVRIWDPIAGTSVGSPLSGHTGPVLAVTAFRDPGGRTLLASGSADQTVRIWDPITGILIGQPWTGHAGKAQWMTAFPGPGGRTLLATGKDVGLIQIWNPVTRAVAYKKQIICGYSVDAVVAFPGRDGRYLLATASSGEVKYECNISVWDIATGKYLGELLTGTDGHIESLTWFPGPDGQSLLATGGTDNAVKVWDPAAITRPWEEDDKTPAYDNEDPIIDDAKVVAVAALPSPHNRILLATGNDRDTIRIWDAADGKPVGKKFDGHIERRSSMKAFMSTEGQALLATVSSRHPEPGGAVQIWNPVSESRDGDLLMARGRRKVLAIGAFPGPDGRTLLVGGGDGITIWNPATHRVVRRPLTGLRWPITAIEALPNMDGRTLLATSSWDDDYEEDTIRVWDPERGTPSEDSLVIHAGRVTAMVAFSNQQGRTLLATAKNDDFIDGERVVQVWDPATGDPIGEPLVGHTDWVNTVATFTDPDGRTLLASGGMDGTIRIWDPMAGMKLATLQIGVGVTDLVAVDNNLAVGTIEGVLLLTLDFIRPKDMNQHSSL